jgi:ATP-binding cassette, subfamily B, bacterial
MSGYEEQDYSKQFDFGLWRKLLRFAKPYKRQLFLLAGVMVVLGTIDAAFPMMNKYAVDNFITTGNADGLGLFALLYGAMVTVQAFNVYALITIAGKIEMGICYDLRTTGFRRLQELSYSYYDRTPVGWIMARMTSDSQRLGETISWGLVDMVWGGAMMGAIAIFMLVMDFRLALIVLAVVPPLAVISLFFQRRILGAFREVRKTNSRISGAFNEGIMGAKTSKALVREEANLKEFQGLTSLMWRSSVRAAVFSALFLPVVLTLASVGTALALMHGGRGVMIGTITYGTLVAFLSYTVQFFEPVRELARVLAEFQSAQASAERVMSMIETEPEIQDRPDVVRTYGDSFDPKTEAWPVAHGAVEFRNVSFLYKDGEPVLDDFDLTVPAGETVALVGATGSGKSTIVNLLCRFYEPVRGSILVDGVDYRERSLLWLHSQLGYVLQAPHLFSGTVRENIRYGRLSASDEEVEDAARLVNADEFIRRMEHGCDSEVGEGGNLLSTGEKQLISFARAVLADPAIFVLDEATSSIDTETERMIQQAIRKVLRGRTSFIIAHRLSTIRSADRILVIQQGRIMEEGTHHELLERKGHYYRLYTNQFVDEQEQALLNG